MRDCMLFVESYLWEFYLWESYWGLCDIDLFGDNPTCALGDGLVSRSTICMGLPPIDGSSFEFLLLRSHSSSSGAGGRPFRPT